MFPSIPHCGFGSRGGGLARVAQVLVLVSIYRGATFWSPCFRATAFFAFAFLGGFGAKGGFGGGGVLFFAFILGWGGAGALGGVAPELTGPWDGEVRRRRRRREVESNGRGL